MISDISKNCKMIFNRYMVTGKNTTVFDDLDLLNDKTEKELKLVHKPHFKDMEFYRIFNKAIKTGQFTNSSFTKK